MSQTQRQHFLEKFDDLIKNYTDEKLIEELSGIYPLIKGKMNPNSDKLMPTIKTEIDKYFESVRKYVKLTFEKYPDINYFPLENWGRYCKYELSGNFFRKENYGGEIMNPYANLPNNQSYCLTEEQEKIICDDEEVFDWIEEFDYHLSDEELIEAWGGDERGGTLLYMDRDLNYYITKSDTPE